MPVSLSYPGVYIEEVPSGVRTIKGVPTSIALFVGWARRGPTDRAVRISSFADFENEFGELHVGSYLGYSVKHYFNNGGADAYVLRIAVEEAGNGLEAAATASCSISNLTVSATSPGEWANDDYQVRLTPRIVDDEETRFSIEVLHTPSNDAVVESFVDLSMSESDPRYVESVINGPSSIISVSVNETTTPPEEPQSLVTEVLTGGADGSVIGPDDESFRTALLLPQRFGVGSITDRIDLFNILCVPGLTDGGTIQDLQRYCYEKRALLIVDALENANVEAHSDPDPDTPEADPLNGLTGDYAKNAAYYFPWVKAPDDQRGRAVRAFPPCGFVAGVYARTDSQRGVWKAPAGSDASLNGVVGFEINMSDADNGKLNPLAINCLRTRPVFGHVVWGARTLQGDDYRGSEWKYVPVRRTALFIEESLYRGSQWVVFEPNDEPLWAQIRLNVGAFMHDLFRQGAFQGTSPKDAYFVKCNKETTTQSDINRGIVNIVVGFAPLKPAEFVVIKLQQIAGQIQT